MLRPDLPPLPENMKGLRIHNGYPVPWFVPLVNGVPDPRLADRNKLHMALKQMRCWVCGKRLLPPYTFVIGPMCVVNRTTAEPANHYECAEFSAKACPFLTKPHMKRRGCTEEIREDLPGMAIMRNPGVTALYTSERFSTFADGKGGRLIDVGEALHVKWFAEGRAATRAEVLAAVESGLPLLRRAFQGQPDAADEERLLQKYIARAALLYPKE